MVGVGNENCEMIVIREPTRILRDTAGGLDVLDKSLEPEIHVQLLMTVE